MIAYSCSHAIIPWILILPLIKICYQVDNPTFKLLQRQIGIHNFFYKMNTNVEQLQLLILTFPIDFYLCIDFNVYITTNVNSKTDFIHLTIKQWNLSSLLHIFYMDLHKPTINLTNLER